MSIHDIPYPPDFDIDYHTDLRETRRRRAFKALEIGDVLAEVDSMIASDPEEQHHPLFSLTAHALDRTTMPGTGEALQQRFGRMIDHAIERLIEAKLADPAAWEVD